MDFCATAGTVVAIRDGERATVGLDNLQCKDQADTHAAGLGGIERNKKVGRVGEAGAVVFYKYDDAVGLMPANHGDPHGSSIVVSVHRCIDSVADQVDEGLFELGCINVEVDILRDFESDFRARLQVADASQQRSSGR